MPRKKGLSRKTRATGSARYRRRGLRRRMSLEIAQDLCNEQVLKERHMKRLATLVALVLAVTAQGVSAQTLKAVKDRGMLNCGANGTLAGFGLPDAQGKWAGLDVDFCRAIAAAVLNDANKVKYVPLSAKDRFTALQSGEVDVLARNTTWTSSRDTSLGLNFVGVNYYDGQGFMVRKSLKVNSALELNSASICVQQGTTTELNLADFFGANKMQLKSVTFATANEAVKAYDAGRCDAYTTDASALYAERLRVTNPDDHVILPEIICFVGTEGNYGEQLGLTKDWAVRIIKQVGNYGESFERNVGMGSPLKIERGLNKLWTKGGIQYAPPIR